MPRPPLGHVNARDGGLFLATLKCWSGRWESNPRHTAWEAVVLPLNYARKQCTIPNPPPTGQEPSMEQSRGRLNENRAEQDPFRQHPRAPDRFGTMEVPLSITVDVLAEPIAIAEFRHS